MSKKYKKVSIYFFAELLFLNEDQLGKKNTFFNPDLFREVRFTFALEPAGAETNTILLIDELD